nr:hypothetical protein [Pseudomonas sp. BIGb0427]
MPGQRDVRFTFSSTADIDFDVVSFELNEGISQLYRLTIELVSATADADFATLLDQPAALTLWQGNQAVRHVHGLISRFEQGQTGFRRTATAPRSNRSWPARNCAPTGASSRNAACRRSLSNCARSVNGARPANT